jgi:hypothetical protein
MKKLILLALVTFQLTSISNSAELIDPKDVLGIKLLCISDGSSVYIFFPDKQFQLAPVDMSGRTIEGTWSLDSKGLHIKGRWGAVNGFSTSDDFREMDIHIGSLTSETTEIDFPMAGGKRQVSECYFYIERLEKAKKENKAEMAAPRRPSD